MYRFGQYLTKLLKGDADSALESRRNFLLGSAEAAAAAAAMAVFGCSQDAPPKRADTRSDFQKLFDGLSDRFDAISGKELGPRTVVVLADIHYEEIANRNLAKLEHLATLGFTHVGIEGVVNTPDSPEMEATYAKLREILSVPDSAALEDVHGGRSLFVPSRGNYGSLFTDERYTTIGVDQPSTMLDVGIGAHMEDMINQLMGVVAQQAYTPVEVDGKLLPQFYQLKQISKHYADDPNFPHFNPEAIPLQYFDGSRSVRMFGPEQQQLVGEMAVKFMQWTEKLHDPRDLYAVKRMVEFMDEQQTDKGVIIYGAQHCRKDGNTSIPQELEKRNISNILIAP